MIGPVVIGGGSSGGGGSTPAPRYVRHATETIIANGVWSRDAAIAASCAGYAPPDVRLQIELIGGGASGSHGFKNGAPGGAPGGVAFVKDNAGGRLLSVADLETEYGVTIGLGGAESASSVVGGANTFSSNPGGSTLFGEWMVSGGGGFTNLAADGPFTPSSDVPLASPRSLAPSAARDAPLPSAGPGAGGTGCALSGFYTGTDGGASGAQKSSTVKAGGVAPNNGGYGAIGSPGLNAEEDGYGSGGGGGGRDAGQKYGGGAGGFPGGGGGAGGCRTGNSTGVWESSGGAGGNGCVRITYFVPEAA